MVRWHIPAVTIFLFAVFWLSVAQQHSARSKARKSPASVAISAPVQVLLYGGDRFLAANMESIRATASATTPDAQHYRLLAHKVVSQLNPCHEDNYWIGNASLSWGGAESEGFELLKNAVRCRYWDEWPAFFYGFNQSFFLNDIHEARLALEIAAERSTDNAAAFRTFSTMLAAGKIDNIRAALKFLISERDKVKDSDLREMLDKRVKRMQGLLALRDAQIEYEKRFGKPLFEPVKLIEAGILKDYPTDPLGIGYEFHEQTFRLKKMTIGNQNEVNQ